MASDASKVGIPTEYALLEDVAKNNNMGDGSFWHLRTTISGSNLIPVVWPDGDTDAGFTNPFRAGVRPSLWLDPFDTEDAVQSDVQEADQNAENYEGYDGEGDVTTNEDEVGNSASGNDITKYLDLDN